MMLFSLKSYSQDILICDNGGFEQDYLFYTGQVSNFNQGGGSATCSPVTANGQPCVFTNNIMPDLHRFFITPSGIDPVVNVSKTRFGSKSFMLNSYCSNQGDCNHQGDINRLKKRFLVTDENRDFTVWYSAILENPGAHSGRQPFFSIRCDLAISDDLCFDGLNFQANEVHRGLIDGCNIYDRLCFLETDIVKYTDWACHRIHIPKEMVGEFATLDITAADCGQNGGHFGYVYIDGICESCDGGSYGAGTLLPKTDMIVSCVGDSITIKGNYTLPTIYGVYTILDGITVPGFTIYGMNINPTSKTFSFRIVKSDFQSPNPDCRDVIAYLDFKNSSGDHLPLVPTNSLEICLDDFVIPEVDITIGGCNRNDPSNNIYSDDYYYVNFDIDNADNIHWTLERQIDDQLPGETGRYFLNTNGYGNVNYNLGPFLIQEGSWILILNYNHCSDTFQIVPPDYCSGCPGLAKAKIFDIDCTLGNNWSYKIMIPPNPNVQNEYYKINGNNYNFGVPNTIPVLANGDFCEEVNVEYWIGAQKFCTAKFDICPPRKCADNEGCYLEAYLKKLNCINNGVSYSIELNVKGASSPCFKAFDNAGILINSGSFSNPLGNYSQDITLKLYTCGLSFGCNCTTNCYKLLKIRRPMDCNRSDFGGGASSRTNEVVQGDLTILPNPVSADEFVIKSKLKITSFDIINVSGKIMYSGSFEGKEQKVNLKLPTGVYIVKYKNQFNENGSLIFVRF